VSHTSLFRGFICHERLVNTGDFANISSSWRSFNIFSRAGHSSWVPGMPPTRVSTSDTAGRLRIPYVSIAQTSSRQRRTRNAASQSEASGSQDLLQYPQNTSSIRRGSRNNAASRSHRDLSSIHEDTQATPRARDARHSRTRSLASTATSVLHSPQDRPAKRRLHVRPSLTGAQVEEMTIERRAEVVADVAGDCLVKLLRAGLRGDELRKGGDEWRKAWDGLKSKSFSSAVRTIAAETLACFRLGSQLIMGSFQRFARPTSSRSTRPPFPF
jgi:hypothetical protein